MSIVTAIGDTPALLGRRAIGIHRVHAGGDGVGQRNSIRKAREVGAGVLRVDGEIHPALAFIEVEGDLRHAVRLLGNALRNVYAVQAHVKRGTTGSGRVVPTPIQACGALRHLSDIAACVELRLLISREDVVGECAGEPVAPLPFTLCGGLSASPPIRIGVHVLRLAGLRIGLGAIIVHARRRGVPRQHAHEPRIGLIGDRLAITNRRVFLNAQRHRTHLDIERGRHPVACLLIGEMILHHPLVHEHVEHDPDDRISGIHGILVAIMNGERATAHVIEMRCLTVTQMRVKQLRIRTPSPRLGNVLDNNLRLPVNQPPGILGEDRGINRNGIQQVAIDFEHLVIKFQELRHVARSILAREVRRGVVIDAKVLIQARGNKRLSRRYLVDSGMRTIVQRRTVGHASHDRQRSVFFYSLG